jgi:segregation and condensation protein A
VAIVNAEVVNEVAPETVEEESEPAVEPETEETVNAEVVTEAVPEPVEEEADPLVEPETADTPEAMDMAPCEPFKEPEPVTEAEPEAVAELVSAPPIEQAAPVAALSLTATPTEPAEPERAPEPVVEQTSAADSVAQLVLTAESSAEEKADIKAEEKAAAKLAARQKKLDESSEQSPFSVFVGQVYDGPLDLLLDLIRKQAIDIYDIPIARITAQFLAYVNQLRAGDVDVAGEFIYTASLLIHIKSKMLLPRAPSGPEDVAEDPRRELVERLLEHERFKNAAQMLQQKQMLEAATWSNPGVREFKGDEGAEPEIAADTVDLVRIFRDILERARNRPVLDVEEDSVTVGQMIQFLARRLTMEDKPVALRRLLSHTRSERALIAMFLALLEMVRLQAILLRQDRQFSEIFIKKHTGFDAVMNEGLGNARDDWR